MTWSQKLLELMALRRQQPGWRDGLMLRVSAPDGMVLRTVIGSVGAPASRPVDRIPFRIASVTKVYVAASIFRLVEGQQLALGTPILRLISSTTHDLLTRAGYDTAKITVLHLLDHTSGLPDHSCADTFLRRLRNEPQHVWSRAEQIAIATSQHGPLGAPGEQFAYSDTGYVVLGEIVERIVQVSLPLAVRKLLDYDALGLLHSEFEGHDASIGTLGEPARQWMGDTDAGHFDPTFDYFGGGGIVSTLQEMDQFFRAMFAGKVFRSPDTLARLFEAQGVDCGFGGYRHNGLMFRTSINGADAWGHTGFWGVLAAYLPEQGWGLTATVNKSREEGSYEPDQLLIDIVTSIA